MLFRLEITHNLKAQKADKRVEITLWLVQRKLEYKNNFNRKPKKNDLEKHIKKQLFKPY